MGRALLERPSYKCVCLLIADSLQQASRPLKTCTEYIHCTVCPVGSRFEFAATIIFGLLYSSATWFLKKFHLIVTIENRNVF